MFSDLLNFSFLRYCLPWKYIRSPYNKDNIIKPSLMLQYILCDHSIMINKRRTNREMFSGNFLYLAPRFSPWYLWERANCADTAGFILFVFLPLYVPAAGLLGLLPWASCVDSWFPCHLMSTSSFSNANPLPKLPEISRRGGWRTAKFHTSAV